MLSFKQPPNIMNITNILIRGNIVIPVEGGLSSESEKASIIIKRHIFKKVFHSLSLFSKPTAVSAMLFILLKL